MDSPSNQRPTAAGERRARPSSFRRGTTMPGYNWETITKEGRSVGTNPNLPKAKRRIWPPLKSDGPSRAGVRTGRVGKPISRVDSATSMADFRSNQNRMLLSELAGQPATLVAVHRGWCGAVSA